MAGSEAVPVTVATAEKGEFPVFLNGIGTVQAWNTVNIHSRVDGEIVAVDFQQGQNVNKGDPLVQIDPRPFHAALDQAKAKQALDEAQLANSRRDLERYTKVGTLGNSQQQIDTQTALVAQQTAQVKADAAAVESAQVQLDYTRIKAPISGRMGFRLIDSGNIVHAADTASIASITQLQPISVVFTAPEDQLPRIAKAMEAGPLECIALSADGKTELGRGSVALINNQIDQATGSVQLKAQFPNPDDALWPGLTVVTRLRIETLEDVVIVPDAAVNRGPQGLYAYVVGADHKVAMRPLEVAVMQNGRDVVTKGVSAGELVVTAGQYRLQPGARVEGGAGGEDGSTAGARRNAGPARSG
jgi:multidrug efflux system membrane fusion protein